ncbi:ankyrin [Piromyces finnis]|uniref:Ankyrin n=1 Tax=Piromyces finnis TaxID=1754191 RepID=A0A1Y1VGR2_9FUNG|nr:ankyrin [Piromyces finnis]|eukprot:ORX54650.1 ankyrin [Piromyces finnis]
MSEEYAHILRNAIAEHNLITVKKLISEKKATIQCPNPENGWNSLFYAIRYNAQEIFNYLMFDAKHEINGCSKDFQKNNAAIIAAKYKNLDAFNVYVELFPDIVYEVNNDGCSPLHIAAQNGMRDMVIKLLDMNIPGSIKDKEGNTPLHYASAWNQGDIISLLIERNCSLEIKNNAGWTPFDFAYSLDLKQSMKAYVNEICEGQRTNIENLKVGMSIQSINFGSNVKIESSSNSLRQYY